MDSILEVRGLSKRYGDRQALDDVNLRIAAGEIFSLLGPNGAGKTTLIRVVCGRLAPDQGIIRVCGGEPRRNAAVRKRLGFVPQEIALYPDLTVRENLEVLGRLAGLARAEIRAAVSQALERAELGDRCDERVDRLSGGMRRRANLVAGTLHRPALLLLDEPTVGVDPNAREGLHALLRRLRDAGTAILLTTHDLEEAERLADRTAFLVDGRVRASGNPAGLIDEHFGNSKELTVALAGAAGDEAAAVLRAAGLSAARDDSVWTGRTADFAGLAELGPRLADAGAEACEIRVREPGLREVFHRVTGLELTR